MNGGQGGAATRHEMVRMRRRLERVRKGSDLLKRKRRALVAELFRAAAPAVDAREEVAGQARAAYPALLAALSDRGQAELTASGRPGRDLELEIRTTETWGMTVAEITGHGPVRRGLPARGAAPGLSGPAAVEAAEQFEALVELLLDAASRELLLRRLADALSRTSRQLNTLEQRVAPRLEERISRTRRVLEEREREEHLRVRLLLKRREPGGGGGGRGRGPGGLPSAGGPHVPTR